METPLVSGSVFRNPDPNTVELQQLSVEQQKRITLYNRAVTLALKELGWENSPPTMFFSDSLVINGMPRAGGTTQTSQYFQEGPHLFFDIGTEIAEKAFAGASIQGMRRFGLTDDQIRTIAAISTAVEETFHWVELMQGVSMPNSPHGLLPGYTKEQYCDQPHERRAYEFQLQMLNRHLLELTGIEGLFIKG